jgi:hypothetical protein
MLEASGNDTIGLKFNDSWKNETHDRIESLLSGTSHLLCVVDSHDSAAAWLSYVIGLARGRELPLLIFSVDPAWRPGPWLADLQVFYALDELVGYYAVERDAWSLKEARRRAKASLLELGISWHSESLSQCVRDGDTKAVALFLDSGFPPDARDKSGVPIVCLATRSRHRSIVELLLDRGANVDAQSDDRGYSPLMDAAQQGDASLLELVLDRGADPNLISKDGQTALILAVGRSDAPVVERLLASGADPDFADKLGLSAMKYAKLFNNQKIVEAFASA